MTDTKLGTIITGPAQRDAIHIAICPMTTDETLLPGQHVMLKDGKAINPPFSNEGAIGVVDPFLQRNVKAGETFWLLLYPQTITGLRHEWSHPAFQETPKQDVSRSEKWLRGYATRVGLSYQALMDSASDFLETGEMYCFKDDIDEYVTEEFWFHYQSRLGIDIPENKQGNFFRCAC